MSRYKTIKVFIGCLLFAVLLGIMFSLSFAQENQNTQKPNPEIETLKNRISELESQLQTVENEKIELTTKLAEANAKLRNGEIDKFKRELKDTNDEWLREWSLWFLTIIGIFVAILLGVSYVFWYWLRSRADQLIADSVEKSLNGFKEAVGQVNILKDELKETVGQVNILQDQIRVLEKEHAASELENYMGHYRSGDPYPQQIEALSEQAILDVLSDETRYLALRCKAAEVLANRKSTRLISPALKYLNSVVDSDFDWEQDFTTQYHMRDLVNFLGYIGTPEVYEGLKKFLDRLLTENPEDKGLVLTPTAFALACVSSELNKRDSVSILKRAIPFFRVSSDEDHELKTLAEYFEQFNEPDGIKDILTNDLTDMMPEVETKCLELLQKHDPDFVEKRKAQKAVANMETEESS